MWTISYHYRHSCVRTAVSRIESHNSSSPLFLYVAYQAPHFPIMEPPATYLKMYSGPQHNSMRRRGALNRPATISALDAGVGQIVAALKRSGLWKDSVLLFSTDNGGPVPGSSNLPLRGNKEDISGLCSHRSNSYITALSLVESSIVLK